jgi:hypothetical protein
MLRLVFSLQSYGHRGFSAPNVRATFEEEEKNMFDTLTAATRAATGRDAAKSSSYSASLSLTVTR